MRPTFVRRAFLLVTALATLLGLVAGLVAPGAARADQTPADDGRPWAAPAYEPGYMPVDIELAAASQSGADLNCRYGVASWPGTMPWLDVMGVGWYINFAVTPQGGDAEFVHVVRIKQDKVNGQYLDTVTISPPLHHNAGGLGNYVTLNPGRLWLIGNEPDVRTVQDDTFPDVYARTYHDIYHFIKDTDPTAQVAIGGLSMATPGRLQYLDIVWDAYIALYGEPMPVDVWNIHLYILPEVQRGTNCGGVECDGAGKVALGTDPAIAIEEAFTANRCPLSYVYCFAEHDDPNIFAQQIVALRTWMKEHGQQHKPLIISEFSILFPYVIDFPGTPSESCFVQDEFGNCFPPSRVNAYMSATLDYLESATSAAIGYPADNNRLVQQWLWFSMYVDAEFSGGSSNLLVPDHENHAPGALSALTSVGHHLRNEIAARPTARNLHAGAAANPTINSGETATVSLEFYSNGNIAVNQPFNVTFYSDAALTQVIGTATVNAQLLGCGRHVYSAAVAWSGLPAGVHAYWAKLDSGNAVAESNESVADNVASGLVIVNPDEVFLPAALR